ILKFDGKEIDKSVDLPRLVGNTKPGTRSAMTVLRRGSQRDLNIVVAELEPERPEARAAAPEPTPVPSSNAVQSLGLTLAELSADEAKALKVRGGVRVMGVTGPATRAGLREGDVIVAVANTEVTSVKDVEAALARLEKN